MKMVWVMKARWAFRLGAVLAIAVCCGCKKENRKSQSGIPEKPVSHSPVGLSIAKLSRAKFYEGIKVRTETLSLSKTLLPGKGPTATISTRVLTTSAGV